MKPSEPFSNADTLTITTAGVLVGSLLLQHEYGGYTETWSELLSWTIVVVVVEIHSRTYRDVQASEQVSKTRRYYKWIIAFSIALTSFSRSLEDVRWVVPALTPALLAYRRYLTNELPTHSAPLHSSFLDSIWVTIGIAFCSMVTLTSAIHVKLAGIAVIYFSGLLATYTFLIRIYNEHADDLSAGFTTGVIQEVGIRTIPFLLLGALGRAALFQPIEVNVGEVLYTAAVKSLGWILLIQITRRAPWDIATTVATFAISSSASPYAWLSILRAFALTGTAVTALAQTISFVPKSATRRNLLLIFVLCPFFPFIKTDVGSRGRKFLSDQLKSSNQSNHPIELLMQKSRADFDSMRSRQSKTLSAATKEYKRRYHRDPPPGFDQWFQFAISHDSPIIDDFDSIADSLKYLWSLTPYQLEKNSHYAIVANQSAIQHCGFRNGEWEKRMCDWMGDSIQKLLGPVTAQMPDVDTVLNKLDEPRLIPIPREKLGMEKWAEDGNTKFFDLSHQANWRYVTMPCDSVEPAPISETGDVFKHGLSFIQDPVSAKDLCKHPEYEFMHGFFQSPTTFLFDNDPVPLMSQAKPSTFGDILYPSPYYTEVYDMEDRYIDDQDPRWEEKKNTLYWAGSSTGGHAQDDGWRDYHRQRFVTKAKHLSGTTNTFLTEEEDGKWKTYQSREFFKELFDTKFTAIIQCEEEICKEEEEFFRPGEYEDIMAGYKSRFIFDLDGNSFSGRFYTLLGSRSVVFKQTIFKEWHDERLFPWVHYVPISLEMDELPETLRYLALTEHGTENSMIIAEESRDWLHKALRKEDASIYLYRLLLELARITDPNRIV